ncbi:MAG: DeoR/GlpR transcriptional regulator [Planctomycetes bacterium]|nr:DeoR/GlpR transcriptional regulator [Planctomycetota bacterium]
MIVAERRSNILQEIELKGFISINDLVDAVQVSESTVRRDLEYLDGIGQIQRTRGGAAYVGDSLSGFEERRTRASLEKQRVAKAAAAIIQSGETILLDGGTTTLEVARQLMGKSLQVVTNSLPIASLLANQAKIELVIIGGYLYPKTGVALGPLAVESLRNLHVRRLVMSVGGITEAGLFNSNALLVETERAMIAAAEEVIVVSDSSKLGHSALSRLCGLESVHRLVIDAKISPDWQAVFRNAGVELNIVEIEAGV